MLKKVLSVFYLVISFAVAYDLLTNAITVSDKIFIIVALVIASTFFIMEAYE